MHINKMASTRSAYKYDSDYSASIPRRRKAKTGVLRSNKIPRRSHDRHHGVHCYCVLCKKSVMPERKYPTHSSKDCTGVRTKRPIKDGMGGTILNRINALQQYKKSENKWKTELKALKKQHKMIYIIAKKSGSRREIKKIEKIRAKASKRISVFPVIIRTPICCMPAIAVEINIYSLLNVRR